MKRRFKWVLVGLAIVAGLTYWLANRGPRYQGHRIAYWLDDSGSSRDQAFRSMGAEAVPYLVRQLKRKDSKLKEFYLENFARLPLGLKNRLPSPMPGWWRRSQAASALAAVGWPARSAVPSLIAVYKQEEAQPFVAQPPLVQIRSGTKFAWIPLGNATKDDILRALASIGGENKELVPLFLDVAAGGNLFVSPFDTPFHNTNMLPALRQSQMLLVRSLAASDTMVRCYAVQGVGQLVVEHDELIVPLIHCLEDRDPVIRMEVTGALSNARKEPAIPLLKDALANADAHVRLGATIVLGHIGPDARVAVPRLLELAEKGTEPDWAVREHAAQALWTIDHRADAMVPYRVRELKDRDDTMRWDAVVFLGRYAPTAGPTVPALALVLTNDINERLRAKAAITLGEIGPGASNVIPALQAALKDEYLNVRAEAAEALKKIRAEGGLSGDRAGEEKK